MATLDPNVELVLREASEDAQKRSHEFICLEHLLLALVKNSSGAKIIQALGGSLPKLRTRLENFVDTNLEKTPNAKYIPSQTLSFQRVLQRAVLHSEYSSAKVLSVGDILASIYTENESHAVYFLREEGIERLDVLDYISHGPRLEYREDMEEDDYDDSQEDFNDELDPEDGEFRQPKKSIDDITEDLTKSARECKLDPVIGREKELDNLILILSRRLKNNPLLVGDQGVGKTAVVEGLAQAIVEEKVPANLIGCKVLSLNLGNLLAGTKYRGDFEQRLKGIIAKLKSDPKTILFIDEIHTLIGAGSTSGSSLDAANILKPALARGEIKCIGSTTFEEYKRIFEKDRALSRRFLKVDIDEPDVETSIKILTGLKSRFEDFHKIEYSSSAIKSAVILAKRHIHDRFLPDKAIDLLDEVGAKLKLQAEKSGSDKKIVVKQKDVETLLSANRNIPQATLTTTDSDKLKVLAPEIKKFIYGQDEAVENITKSILRSRAGLGNLKKPVGSFLLVGPTGVGKTELARQIARVLGYELQKFDMSEYQEKHSVARLIGAPPGYVGHEQGGLLTDCVLKNPMSVILLDEIEKAHADVYNVLLQIMDDGVLTDSTGKKAHFTDCIIVMTSNVGSENVSGVPLGFGNTIRGVDMGALERTFRPEFRNRLDAIVKFNSLPLEVVEKIVDKFISDIDAQLQEKKISLTLTTEARRWFAEKGYNPEYGARSVHRLVQKEIKDKLAEEILFGALKSGGEAHVSLKDDQISLSFVPFTSKKKRVKNLVKEE